MHPSTLFNEVLLYGRGTWLNVLCQPEGRGILGRMDICIGMACSLFLCFIIFYYNRNNLTDKKNPSCTDIMTLSDLSQIRTKSLLPSKLELG